MTGSLSGAVAGATLSRAHSNPQPDNWAIPVPAPVAQLDRTGLPRRMTRADELSEQVGRLLSKLRIAVVHGGDKSEDGSVLYRTHNPRSWKSYRAVAEDIAASLGRLGCRDVTLMADDMRLAQRMRDEGIEFAWLNTGGVQGFCAVSHSPAIMEMLGVPYIGHEPLTAGILDSKHTFKRQLQGLGIPTGRFMTWHASKGRLNPRGSFEFLHAFGDHDGPFIIKPVSGRASLHVEYTESIDEIADIAQHVFDVTQSHVLIEEYLGGREYCVAACGPVIAVDGVLERLDGPFTFAVVERMLDEDERIFTSMDKRPITGTRVRSMSSASDGTVVDELHALARRVFEELNLETLVRLDVRADTSGRLHVLEANPKPDLKAPVENGVTSLIAAGLSQYGMSYDDLILSLLADRLDIILRRGRGAPDHLRALLTNCEA